ETAQHLDPLGLGQAVADRPFAADQGSGRVEVPPHLVHHAFGHEVGVHVDQTRQTEPAPQLAHRPGLTIRPPNVSLCARTRPDMTHELTFDPRSDVHGRVDVAGGVDGLLALPIGATPHHRGYAGRYRLRGNIAGDDGVGADRAVVADRDRAQHLGAGADRDPVADRRVALDLLEGAATQRHPVVDHHIVADLCGLADHAAHAVVDEEAPADGGARVDLDTGDRPDDLH